MTSRKTNLPILSFDDVYCTDLPNGFYSISRIVDPNNLDNAPTLGPRLGFPPLEDQVRGIIKNLGKEIEIMDIGTFEGGTLYDEINGRFKEAGIKIPRIYLAFAGKAGIEKLRGMGVGVQYYFGFDWVDWLEIRDCLGFDGRKVSLNVPKEEGLENLFVRYIERPEKWASIPATIKEEYEKLYNSFFNLIQRALVCEGIQTELVPLKTNHCIYALKIRKIK